jgi:hypothetical protein
MRCDEANIQPDSRKSLLLADLSMMTSSGETV